MIFRNLSTGDKEYTLQEVIKEVLLYISIDEETEYRVIVGSDSLYRAKGTVFATAIVCHRVGKGARFWYTKRKENCAMNIFARIMRETEDSINIMKKIYDSEIMLYVPEENMQIDIDAGNNGKSIKVVSSAMSYVKGSGFNGESKPNAAVATIVADKFTK